MSRFVRWRDSRRYNCCKVREPVIAILDDGRYTINNNDRLRSRMVYHM